MEKAILRIKKKDETFELRLFFPDSQEEIALPASGIQVRVEPSLEGKEVAVLKMNGTVMMVQAGRRDIYRSLFSGQPKSASPSKDAGRQRKTDSAEHGSGKSRGQKTHPKPVSQTPKAKGLLLDHTDRIQHAARAPYNFVPLNTEVVEAPTNPKELGFDRYHADRQTGWIEVRLENSTPLYIRDSLTEDEMKQEAKAAQSGEKFINSNFFSPGGQLKIPGSSLRGMLRNLVEIVSFGKFGPFDDRRLYFRGLADQSNLRKDYQQRMSSYDRRAKKANYKMSAGVLKKCGFNSYEILPSNNFTQIPKGKARGLVQQLGGQYAPFKFYRLGSQYLVVSGDMTNKKKDWLIDFPPPQTKGFPLPDADVKDYLNDRTRFEDALNLIEEAPKYDQGVPCFYSKLKDRHGQERISFGHTAMFRLAYEKTIGDHIPSQLKDPDKIDIAGAIFGNEETFAGRIFVEDAELDAGQDPKQVLMDDAEPRILSAPKPTTFQHYLVQSSDSNKELQHYNSGSAIRGNKLYWHKEGRTWKETDREKIEKSPKQYTRINPVRPGTTFTGRIRFENLSQIELGALLFSLELPEGCLHKLGMGKPLGLGSVRIAPRLFLSKRKARYTSLFSEWKEEPQADNEALKEAKAEFERYVLDRLGESSETSLWSTARLKELEIMLNYKKGLARANAGQTDYMNITPRNDFKFRNVLPKPSQVRSKAPYTKKNR